MRKTEISGLIILFVGVALLIFTFLNAYWFLTQDIGLIATADLTKAFGEALAPLAPLIAACIRIMYLGIMGWIGSLLTLRGISLLKGEPSPQTKVEKKLQQKPMIVPTTMKKEEIQKPQKREELIKPPQKEIKPAASPPQRPEPSKSSEQPTPPEEKREEKPTENVSSNATSEQKTSNP